MTPMEQLLSGDFKRLEGLVAANCSSRYLTLISFLRADRVDATGTVYLGLNRAPAASGNHHAYEGGLVIHLLEMWDFHLQLRDLFVPRFDDGRVLAAIIHHDLEKAYYTFVQGAYGEPIKYGTHTTSQLMTGDVKSLHILMNAGILLDEEMTNALLMAHGGYTDHPPRMTTPFAKYIYLLDEMSGNVKERLRNGVPMKNSGRFLSK